VELFEREKKPIGTGCIKVKWSILKGSEAEKDQYFF
jgi:hypothetical protein